MKKSEMIKIIKKKDPFIITDCGNFQGNFEITYVDAEGLHNAFGWGKFMEPQGPFTLAALKALMIDDEDEEVDGIPVLPAIDAIEKSGVGSNQEVYLGFLGMVGENAEIIVSTTQEECMQELQSEIINCSDLNEPLVEMEKDDILEYYGEILGDPLVDSNRSS